MNAPGQARRLADDDELAQVAADAVGYLIDPFNRRWHTARCPSIARMTTGEAKWYAPTPEAAQAYFEQRIANAPTARPITACPTCRPDRDRPTSATPRAAGRARPPARTHERQQPKPLERASWRFSVSDHSPWAAAVAAAPTEDSRLAFWNVVVPQLAAVQDRAPRPCIVVCRVSAPGVGRAPAGPRARAKALLDALHDDRQSGPMYRDLGCRAPLHDDHPSEVRGLAVEVVPGIAQTEYLLGTRLVIAGELLARIPVDQAAPNDIAGTTRERDRIAADCRTFGSAVRAAFAAHGSLGTRPSTLVIRHRPQRDEDNTWATWTAAVCGTRTVDSWSSGAPLAGWAPTAIASVADPELATAVEYELWS